MVLNYEGVQCCSELFIAPRKCSVNSNL